MAEGGAQRPGPSKPPITTDDDAQNSKRIFKKVSANNMITLYIACRDLVLEPDRAAFVEGVLLLNPLYAQKKNIYGQIVAIFRYGREDEEIMGLQFFNENVINMVRIWPTSYALRSKLIRSSTFQEALFKRLGPNAIPFQIELYDNAQPSVVLAPTKPYYGQPVGTSYDVRIVMDEGPGVKVQRPIIVRMGIRVTYGASRIDTAPLLTPSPSNESFRVKPRYQQIKVQCQPGAPVGENMADPTTEDEYAPIENETVNGVKIESAVPDTNERNGVNEQREERSDTERSENEWESNKTEEPSDTIEEMQEHEEVDIREPAIPYKPRPPPRLTVEKSFLLSHGKVYLETWLDTSSYHHGDRVVVNFRIVNHSLKTIDCIKAYAIQHVNVCMFDNGKFKNVVAMANDSSYSVPPGDKFQDYYSMKPRPIMTKNWLALEPTVTPGENCLASTVVYSSNNGRRRGKPSVFVSYYVKLSLFINKFGGVIGVKLPFSLSHAPQQVSLTNSTTEESANRTYLEEGGCSAEDDGDPKNIKKNDREEPDREKPDNEEDDRNKQDNQEDDGNINDTKEDVNNGNAPIGNQESNPDMNLEERQSYSADVSEDMKENQLAGGSDSEGLPLVRAAKPDEEEFPVGRYLETKI